MNKLTKEKRDRLLLVCLGTGIILAALYLMVISTQKSSLRELRGKVDVAKEKLEKAERWLRMAPGIEARLDVCRKELEAKHEDMAPVDKFKWFYNTMERFLATHPVKLIDITREPEIGELGVLPKFPYPAATFGVKLAARFHDFGVFLAEFENQFPYMRVQNLELEPEGGVKTGGGSSTSALVRTAARSTETLTITMRVVTLVKPNLSL